MMHNSLILPTLVLIVLSNSVFAEPEITPWRLDNAFNLSDSFSLSGQHRVRFENLNEQYRGSRNGGDQALVFRTNVLAKLDFDRVDIVAEMMDSRAELADSGTPLSGTVINPLELLQAYIELPINNVFGEGGKSSIKGGRITMDMGSRRLVARNRFRNTINGFTGIDWRWQGRDKQKFRFFYTLPVQRLFNGNALDNDPKFDKEHEEVRFWGVYYSPSKTPWGDKAEVYLLGLDEEDVTGELNTRDRELYTPGFRLYRKPAENKFSYQVESIFQFGESRSSTISTIDLDHFAYFHHFEIGYSFDAKWSPQLLFQYDYASGDDDAADGENNRFDTLFGARRFDFGPTGIYGPFARSNLSTPGIRLKLKPTLNISSFIALRAYWLASDNDAWTTAGISNVAGQSDNYIGTQLETRVRWDAVPGNIRIEAGAAHIFAGDLMNGAGKSDATYLYSQAVFSF
ncbi:MAG: alginate export family protein [Pseudomonadota bacterium]